MSVGCVRRAGIRSARLEALASDRPADFTGPSSRRGASPRGIDAMQNSDMDAFAINPAQVRDVSSLLLDAKGCLRVVPARTLEATTPQERFLFGVREGVYSFPTVELCEFLRSRIAGRTVIEIGAGHGPLAQALSIPATDNRQQEDEELKAYYQAIGQPTVRWPAAR